MLKILRVLEGKDVIILNSFGIIIHWELACKRMRTGWVCLFLCCFISLFEEIVFFRNNFKNWVKQCIAKFLLFPCVYMHLLQCISYILAMGSVSQRKLTCAIRVWLKHLGESYSTLCCSWILVLPYPLPNPTLRLHAFVAMYSTMLATEVCGSREACMCNKGLIKAFGGKLSNFKQSETN